MPIIDKSCWGRLQMGDKRKGEGKKEGGEVIREERRAGQGLDWCHHLVSSTGGLKLA